MDKAKALSLFRLFGLAARAIGTVYISADGPEMMITFFHELYHFSFPRQQDEDLVESQAQGMFAQWLAGMKGETGGKGL